MPWQPPRYRIKNPEIITSHAQELQSLDEALHMSAHLVGIDEIQRVRYVRRRGGTATSKLSRGGSHHLRISASLATRTRTGMAATRALDGRVQGASTITVTCHM